MKKTVLTVLVLALALTGCSAVAAEPTSTPTSLPQPTATQTLVPTETPLPTETPTPEPTLPPTIMPTIEPMVAVANANVTLRSEPRKGSENVGGLFFNQGIKVIGRNPEATWFYGIWPDSASGHAWVLARAMNLQGDIFLLPIVVLNAAGQPHMFPPLVYSVAGTPLPPNPPGPDAKAAVVAQQANVRVGPGTGYMSIGILEPGTKIALTGRTDGNAWLQIDYPSGLDGRGWVLGSLVSFEGEYAGLPFYNLMATEVPKGSDPNTIIVPEVVLPLAGDGGAVSAPAATATPELPYAVTTAQVNARLGPAASFDVLGLLEPNEKIYLLGLTLNGLWYQIQYPASPSGVAYVAADYVKVMSDVRDLPYVDNLGNPLPKP